MIEDVTTRQAAECPTCSAPLAADQRYCVYCGTRAPQVRLEFLDTLSAAPPPPPAPAPAPASDRFGLPLLAVIAALGVGALLGHWATAEPKAAPAAAPATQVIRVTGEAAPAAAPSATATPEATATATATETPAADKDDDAPAATKDLSKDSVKKAVKKKAPISTGGTPPPKDDKAPAGGSGFETIG